MHKDGNEENNKVENLRIAYDRSEVHYNMYRNQHRKVGKWSGNKITINKKGYRKIEDIANDLGIKRNAIYMRLAHGWDINLAGKIKNAKKWLE